MLESLHVERFRTFRSLTISRLGRINLIVGRNNVGKTMLLEALRLYTSLDTFDAIRTLLFERDELSSEPSSSPYEEDFQLRITSLFHGRPVAAAEAGSIRIGPLDGSPEEVLDITIVPMKFTDVSSAQPFGKLEELPGDVAQDDPSAVAALRMSQGGQQRYAPFSTFADPLRRIRRIQQRGASGLLGRAPFVSARGVGDRELAQWWDSLALREAESRVVECLRVIAPVDRVTMVEHPATRGDRMAMVRLEGETEPVPLKSLGDGMVRLLQIAIAGEVTRTVSTESRSVMLFADRDKSIPVPPLLIDEVENGIHYTALHRLWSFIFKVAELHQIQVFATSHSWDCIAGFQLAAADAPHIDACLVRLEQTHEATRAVVFDRDELGTVAREHIEVR